METQHFPRVWQAAKAWPRTEQEFLDRLLVAGLLLETVLDLPDSPRDHEDHRRLTKTRLKQNLVSHLAGRVTLDHFRFLVRSLENWFSFYYPLLAPAPARPAGVRDRDSGPERPSHPPRQPLREQTLRSWLARQAREVLPSRRHRKLDPEGLLEFLRRTRGGWFRVKDFETQFRIDRKTAWEYLQKFLAAGLLDHNRERSAAVRYCLAPHFLVVAAGDLRRQTPVALPGLSRAVTDRVADFLIATGGEPFWQDEWREHFPGGSHLKIIAWLEAAGLLVTVARSGGSTMLRLPSRWRPQQTGGKTKER